MTAPAFPCVACGTGRTRRLDDRHVTRGVTSDCKPWPRCGRFVICETCGHLQKEQDAEWQADVTKVYAEYEMYVLSGGNEQVIFDAGAPAPRTRRLLELFCRNANLAPAGDWLDVGCGNGSTLRTFANLYPGWNLAGFDVHNRFEPAVRSIPAVVDFFSGALDAVDRQYDVISLVYVIEHLPYPRDVVAGLRRLLKPGGLLLVHTSDYWHNPFDLAVVDHCSHFCRETLAGTVARAGFEVLDSNDTWIAKEVGAIARAGAGVPTPVPPTPNFTALAAGAQERLRWLGEVVDHARAGGPIGVFGTAIAGTWLAAMAPGAVGFFVDEDTQRRGKTHLGHPILHPDDVPAGKPVYLAFPPPVAEGIKARLAPRYVGLDLVAPARYRPAA